MSTSRWLLPAGGCAWMMGVLNCTPNSFSDGGRYIDVDTAIRHGLDMWQADAAIIDVGGESTRPGSVPVSQAEELDRVIPVVKALAAEGIYISIDTSKAEVMRQAIQAGAQMVNDVTALRGDEASLGIVADSGVDVCLMHMQGTPETMQNQPQYTDVMSEVVAFFEQRIDACLKSGIRESAIVLDPGIGFGKRLEDNLALLARLPSLKELGFPLLVGVSRKSFLGAVSGADVDDREIETAAAVAIATYSGADVLRVHDIDRQKRAIKVASAMRSSDCVLKESPDHV